MEIVHGVEALKKIPLKNIFLPYKRALEKLNNRTKTAFRKNFQIVKNKVDLDPEQLKLIKEYRSKFLEKWIDGGFSLTGNELNEILNSFGQVTFKIFLKIFFSKIVPNFFNINESSPREPGVIVMGYLLDFFDIINPKIASFRDGVAILVELMREEPSDFLNPLVMGAMVDDSRNLRTSEGIFFDPFMSPEEVNKFDKVFSSFLNDEEKKKYERGKEIDIHTLALMTIGTTLN